MDDKQCIDIYHDLMKEFDNYLNDIQMVAVEEGNTVLIKKKLKYYLNSFKEKIGENDLLGENKEEFFTIVTENFGKARSLRLFDILVHFTNAYADYYDEI